MLPKMLQSVLWSYNLSSLDLKKNKHLVITQVLNHGNWEQLQWLIKHCKWPEIKEAVVNPDRGSWMPDALNYWMTIFGLRMSKQKYRSALLNLEPR
ncbi:MAG: hypothetical protein ABII74_02635 [Elusimicrobiota bacterium]